MCIIEQQAIHDPVLGLPKQDHTKYHICHACPKGKKTRNSFISKDIVCTSKTLKLLHMDVFSPTQTTSIDEKICAFIIVDYFCWFIWVIFIVHKDDTLKKLEFFYDKVQRDLDTTLLLYEVNV